MQQHSHKEKEAHTSNSHPSQLSIEAVSETEKAQLGLKELYRQCPEEDPLSLSPPLNISALFIAHGTTKSSFPLPGGARVEKNLSVGICNRPKNVEITQIKRYEKAGYLLSVKYKTPGNKDREIKVCAFPKGNKRALIQLWKLQAASLQALYEIALDTGIAKPSSPIDISDLFTGMQRARTHFPLPSGDSLGEGVLLGIPQSAQSIFVSQITFDIHVGYYQMTLVGKLMDGTQYTMGLHVDMFARSSKDILSTREYRRAQLISNYHACLQNGRIILKQPISITPFMNSESALSETFPLIDGSNLGSRISPGFRKGAKKHRIVKFERDSQGRGVTVTAEAYTEKHGYEQITFLLSRADNEQLRKGLFTPIGLQREQLLNTYNRAAQEGEFPLSSPLDISELFCVGGVTKTIFPLPSGEDLREHFSVGLFHGLKKVQLTGITKTSEGNLRLELTGYGPTHATKRSIIELCANTDDRSERIKRCKK